MTVQSFTFGPFQTNTYVVSDLSRDRSDPEEPIVLLVDPACYTESERQTLADYIDSLTGQSVSPKDGLCSVSAAVCQHSGLSVLPTPGHTPGSVCLYWPDEKVLLSGDTLFCMGYGRTDLPGGSYADLIASIRTLFDLPSDVIVYPGHGESTTIGAEKHRYW